jgi:ATP-dependent Clp protease ATP-binding subunit ClpA
MDSVTKPTLFGRRSELGVIAQFLDEVPRRSSALVLVGEAGIGKTTLWEAGVESASTEVGLCSRLDRAPRRQP